MIGPNVMKSIACSGGSRGIRGRNSVSCGFAQKPKDAPSVWKVCVGEPPVHPTVAPCPAALEHCSPLAAAVGHRRRTVWAETCTSAANRQCRVPYPVRPADRRAPPGPSTGSLARRVILHVKKKGGITSRTRCRQMIDCTPIVIRPRPNRTPAMREFSPTPCFRARAPALRTAPGSGCLDPKDAAEARPDAACRPADSNIRPGTLLIPGTRYGPAACGTAGSAKPSKSTRSARPAPDPGVFGSGRAPAAYGPPTAAHACGPSHKLSPAQDARPSTRGRDPQARGRFPPPASANTDPGRNLPDGTFF